jgi:hypothetical protein
LRLAPPPLGLPLRQVGEELRRNHDLVTPRAVVGDEVADDALECPPVYPLAVSRKLPPRSK